jgi:hypothetical protein
VPPAPPVPDLTRALVALVTESGVVPYGNPDRLETWNASKWFKYPIAGLQDLERGKYQAFHGGCDTTWTNEDPDRAVPLDAARILEKEGIIGRLHDSYYVTTGNMANIKTMARIGAEIARDWSNARGGVNGRQIQLLIEDNKSDPKEAASAAEKLIARDQVPVLMGAWGSSMTLAAMPKLEEYGVPMVVETSSAASITKRGNPWVFRISPPSEMEALGLEKYLGALGIRQADFMAVNTDWGRGAVTAFGDMLRRHDAGVGAVESLTVETLVLTPVAVAYVG